MEACEALRIALLALHDLPNEDRVSVVREIVKAAPDMEALIQVQRAVNVEVARRSRTDTLNTHTPK